MKMRPTVDIILVGESGYNLLLKGVTSDNFGLQLSYVKTLKFKCHTYVKPSYNHPSCA